MSEPYSIPPEAQAQIDKMCAAGPPDDPLEAAKQLLKAADVFYHNCDEELEDWGKPYTLNMNDTWAWATGWGVEVPEADLPEVARLYRSYGYCGVLYWVSEQEGQMRSEFHDINRFVDFVREEERFKARVEGSSKRAYTKHGYVLGFNPRPWWKFW